MRLIENGYLDKLKELIGENDKNNQFSNLARNTGLNLDDQISFVSYGGMLIYGHKNCGKTYEVLKILEKYSHVYIDVRLYQDKKRAVQNFINNFSDINPAPLFLLIRDGIQYYDYFYELTEQNIRLVFIENDLRFLYFSLLQNIVTLNFNEMIKKEYAQNYPHLQNRINQHPQERILQRILGQNYNKIASSLCIQVLAGFQSLLQKQLPLSNLKITFAKIYSQLLKLGYRQENSFIFACAWSFGSYTEENHFMNVFLETFSPIDDKKKTELINARLWNDKMVDLLNKINVWIKEGKIQSVFDLVPVNDSSKFLNNLNIKIDYVLPGIDERKVCMELGMIQNLKLIRGLHQEWKIKVEARQWLSSVVMDWMVDDSIETIVLQEAQKLKFSEIINHLLYRIKKNKSTFAFPKIRQIIIDDMHLQSFQNYVYFQHLSTYKTVLYIN